MGRERHAVAQVATAGSCIDARPTPVGMAAASGSPTAALLAAIAWQGQQDFAATAAPIGVCRGRECGNQQPSHVISSSLHVMHAAHANGAYQQAAAASTVRVASGDGPRATCSRSGSYRRQLHRRQADSGRHGRCIAANQQPLPPLAAIEWQVQVLAAQVFAATADWRVSRP